MKKLIIILDPAHGSEVLGKRSPDGTHREYLWSRNIIEILSKYLTDEGFTVITTNATDNEIGLTKRSIIASSYKANPGQTKFLLSLHNNAAGYGNKWEEARGVEIFTSKGHTKSDDFATAILYRLKLDFPELKFRYDHQDGDPDKESNFTVLMGKGYYAALLEWLFQDNKEDVELLKDENYNLRLINSLVAAIKDIEDTL